MSDAAIIWEVIKDWTIGLYSDGRFCAATPEHAKMIAAALPQPPEPEPVVVAIKKPRTKRPKAITKEVKK